MKVLRVPCSVFREPLIAARACAAYGVPALAGNVLPFEGGMISCETQGESPSDRLKPGLHTLFGRSRKSTSP